MTDEDQPSTTAAPQPPSRVPAPPGNRAPAAKPLVPPPPSRAPTAGPAKPPAAGPAKPQAAGPAKPPVAGPLSAKPPVAGPAQATGPLSTGPQVARAQATRPPAPKAAAKPAQAAARGPAPKSAGRVSVAKPLAPQPPATKPAEPVARAARSAEPPPAKRGEGLSLRMAAIYTGALVLVGVIGVDGVIIQRTLAERTTATTATSASARAVMPRADVATRLAAPAGSPSEPEFDPAAESEEPGEELPPGETTVVDPGLNKPKGPVKNGQSVEQAFSRGCSTSSVEGLSRQIVAEARCMNANAFAKVPARKNLVTPGHVFLHLEAPARDQLVQVLDAHPGLTMTVNSAFRTVAQQYLLDRWARTKRCGIKLAAKPGESNHETGLALDVSEHGTWRAALESQGFRWLGPTDRVHFDYQGSGAGHHEGLDILAFQRLWNRNHPEDRIAETSHYDDATESHLRKSPAGGFPVGPQCSGASHPADRPTSRTTRKSH